MSHNNTLFVLTTSNMLPNSCTMLSAWECKWQEASWLIWPNGTSGDAVNVVCICESGTLRLVSTLMSWVLTLKLVQTYTVLCIHSISKQIMWMHRINTPCSASGLIQTQYKMSYSDKAAYGHNAMPRQNGDDFINILIIHSGYNIVLSERDIKHVFCR